MKATDVQSAEYFLKALSGVVIDENGCWLWASVNGRGYGYFGKRRAHRVIYELASGPIPEGLVLDHRCGVPRCVNPDHLEPVTQAVNMQRRRDRKLTETDAAEIRDSSEDRDTLAARYGVHRTMIWRIRTGRSWA